MRAAYSFDEPDAFDTPALVQCLQSLKVSPVLSCACIASARWCDGLTCTLQAAPVAMLDMLTTLQAMQAVQVPVYDFTLHQRAQETRRVEPADVVIIEGILVLHSEPVRKLLNMKIYVDTDDDVRLARRYTIQAQISDALQLHRKLYALAFCRVPSARLPECL